MSEGVIDVLEAVKPDEENSNGSVLRRCLAERLFQLFRQVDTVWQTGQCIVVCQVSQLIRAPSVFQGHGNLLRDQSEHLTIFELEPIPSAPDPDAARSGCAAR